MYSSKINRLLFRSLLLSNILNIIVIALTIYRHFTIDSKIEKLKGT
ncbi:hypothetical protein [Jeotgalicoccus halotolerans]|nr:hypothetical protein [Jeotgalicoccus halotolerans]